MFVFNLIMTVSMYMILPIMYMGLKGTGKLRNDGILVGVKIPLNQRKNPIVMEVQEKYPKSLKRWCIISALMPIVIFFIPWFSISFTLWMMWIIEVIVALSVPVAVYNKRLMDTLRREHWENEYDEEQNHWHWGIFYYNQQDNRTTIATRVGTGMTMNLAKTSGKILTGVGVVGILVIPVMCVWMILTEFIPLQLTVENNALIAHQINDDYEIALDDIEQVELVKELPGMSKTSGEAMDTLRKGNYHIRNVGDCKVFANPKNSEFIELKTEKMTYYLSAATDEETLEVYKLLR